MLDMSTMMVSMSAETALGQAKRTTLEYMMTAKHDIDDTFGKGFAKAHPELVAAYMATASADFHTAS